MPSTQETEPIMKCPHCDAEIDCLDFRADATERGSCTIYAAHQQRPIGSGRNQRWESIPGQFEVQTDDFSTDDSEWTRDTDYYCPECGDCVGLHEIVIESAEEKEKREQEEINEEEIEPDDAVESKTNIVLKFKEEDRGARGRRIGGSTPIQINEIDAFVCEDCGHVFVNAGDRYGRFTNDDSIIACPICGFEINPKENRKKILAEAT